MPRVHQRARLVVLAVAGGVVMPSPEVAAGRGEVTWEGLVPPYGTLGAVIDLAVVVVLGLAVWRVLVVVNRRDEKRSVRDVLAAPPEALPEATRHYFEIASDATALLRDRGRWRSHTPFVTLRGYPHA